MTQPRIAPVLIVALLSFSGCGGGCGREDRAKSGGEPRPDTSATRPTATTTAAPVVHDGKTSRLYRPRRWDVGDVVTHEVTTVITGRVTEIADGRPSRLPSTKETVHATWVEKAVDVDDDGRRMRYLVDLRTWLRTQADVRDETLQKTSLAVSGTGAKRTWSFVAREAEPNAEATNWLDGHFGSRGLSEEQWLRMMLPDDDVAVGESWSPDPVRLVDEMEGGGLSIDRASVTATVTLEAIEGGLARCSFNGKLGLLRIPNSEVPMSKGMMTFEGEMSFPLEPEPLVLSTVRLRGTLEGETLKNGVITRFDFASDERSTTTPGGDFPQPAP
jgi:hypothetical protein